MEELASLDSLSQLAESLAETDYGRHLSGSRALGEVERGLAEALIERLAQLLEIAEGRARTFLQEYLRKYEVQNLTWILRMRAGGASREEVEGMLLPTERLGGVRLEPLLEAEDLEALKKVIRGSGVYEVSEEAEDPIQLEADLWRSYYHRILRLASRLRIGDSGDVRGLLGLELDLMNLRTCVLGLLRGWDSEKIGSLLIANPAGIPLKKLQALIEEGDPHAIVERFRGFKDFLERALAGEEWAVEVERLRIMKRYADSRRISKFISLFYVLRYILELEIEYRNLRSIAISIHHNLPPELRRSLLVLG